MRALVKKIFSSQEYQTSKYQKTDMLIEFSILDLVKNSDLFIDLGSISLFFGVENWKVGGPFNLAVWAVIRESSKNFCR